MVNNECDTIDLINFKIVIDEGSDREWSKKYCRAVNDPHLLTFDQRYYPIKRFKIRLLLMTSNT